MLDYELFVNQKELEGEEKQRLASANFFLKGVARLLVSDLKNMHGPHLKLIDESRELQLRGLNFIDLKSAIRENWPHMATRFVERTGDRSGKLIFYTGEITYRQSLIYVTRTGIGPIVVHLSDAEGPHTNHFILYGENKATTQIKNILEACGRNYGYSPLESQIK